MIIGTFCSVLQSRDNASYECLAENGVGEPVRANAMLQVYSGKHVLSLSLSYIFISISSSSSFYDLHL